MEPIVNRVSKSPLITLDLEDFYPVGKRLVFDIAPWLKGGQILIEKQFREAVSKNDWQDFKDAYVAISCSADAIIPSWAYLLVSAHLASFTKLIVVGDLNLLETVIFAEIISNLDIEKYKNKPIIIKGCSSKPIPDTAFTALVTRLKPVVKSIMYGEACSTVLIFKKKN